MLEIKLKKSNVNKNYTSYILLDCLGNNSVIRNKKGMYFYIVIVIYFVDFLSTTI